MKILFVCTLNAVRSPIAQSLASTMFLEHEFYSAGLIEGPPDYFAIEVMKEIGIDISNHKSKSLESYQNQHFDLVIFLADEAMKSAMKQMQEKGYKCQYWDIPSPGQFSGNRIMKLFGYREIRDKIRSKLINLQ